MPAIDQDIQLSDTEQKQVKEIWNEAVIAVNPPAEQSTAQALALGVNFRVHLGKAFAAAWATSKVAAKAAALAHAPFNIFGWMAIGPEFVGAAAAVFSSLVQRMRPIDYVTCVVLSEHSEGLTEDELRMRVEEFLNNPEATQFSWYFGMNDSLIRRAKEVATNKGWINGVLSQLRTTDFLDESHGKIRFKSHHFNVGWRAE